MDRFASEDYQIWYDSHQQTWFFQGILRLEGMGEYQIIMAALLKTLDDQTQFTLNLESLEFLNSSGISMLSMFVVKVREKKTVQLTLKGSSKILWQNKSLRNLQRLMPSLILEL